jgi:hypothetical protein
MSTSSGADGALMMLVYENDEVRGLHLVHLIIVIMFGVSGVAVGVAIVSAGCDAHHHRD